MAVQLVKRDPQELREPLGQKVIQAHQGLRVFQANRAAEDPVGTLETMANLEYVETGEEWD